MVKRCGKRKKEKGKEEKHVKRRPFRVRGGKERIDFTQRTRYSIMYADTKRTCNGRYNAHRQEGDVKIQSWKNNTRLSTPTATIA